MTVLCFGASAENDVYKAGDTVQFGSYPQSKVTDSTIISALESMAPSWDNWTSYGYYSGDGEIGSMVEGDWMRYTDVIYNGVKYRGVKFTQYRGDRTYRKSTSHQIRNGYNTDTNYWFKYEPLKWRILDTDTGLVLCETIIDAQPYSNTVYNDSQYTNFNDALFTNYASDYATSSVRNWLNEDFYNTAFTVSEKGAINITTLNNDCYDTITGPGSWLQQYDSIETNDKIFILSLNEATNSDYGFLSRDNGDYDPAREAQGSDYAKCQGLGVQDSYYTPDYNGNSQWLLRSAYTDYWVCGVNEFGCYGNAFEVYNTYTGIRPALCFVNIPEHQHSYSSIITKPATHLEEGIKTFTCSCGDSYTSSIAKLKEHKYIPTITEPTCTEQGYTTYTCACSDSYTADYVDALGHKDDNGDYKCDNGCSYEFEKPAPENPSDDCSCKCHKSGIMGFIWKIIRFFQKLFKINPICSCGVAHY